MRHTILLLVVIVVGITPPAITHSAPQPAAACQDTALAGGANARVCIPVGSAWAGDVIVYVPGFSPTSGFRNLALPDGTSLPDLIVSLGYAFATTDIGLVDDTRTLLQRLPTLLGRAPRKVFLAGVSQGGLVVTQIAERPTGVVNGVLAICGPIGDYARQVDYFGDFRVLFDYYFPGSLPASPIEIPQILQDTWESSYRLQVGQAVAANPTNAARLIAASTAAIDPTSPQTIATSTISTTISVLWYNVYATNPANLRYGGNVYTNTSRSYSSGGLDDDPSLNAGVQRFAAVPTARAGLSAEETSGILQTPLVVLHTIGDEIVPIWHVDSYQTKVAAAGGRGLTVTRIQRYGHCNVTGNEILQAFSTLLQQSAQWRWQVALPIVQQ